MGFERGGFVFEFEGEGFGFVFVLGVGLGFTGEMYTGRDVEPVSGGRQADRFEGSFRSDRS